MVPSLRVKEEPSPPVQCLYNSSQSREICRFSQHHTQGLHLLSSLHSMDFFSLHSLREHEVQSCPPDPSASGLQYSRGLRETLSISVLPSGISAEPPAPSYLSMTTLTISQLVFVSREIDYGWVEAGKEKWWEFILRPQQNSC